MENSNNINLSPIIIFVYKRIDTLSQNIFYLQKDLLAIKSDLIIFSDGAKDRNDIEAVNQVRDFVSKITGFKSVTWRFSEQNKGLSKSIINGVSEVIVKSRKVIVLEDDLIVSENFLTYMNQALNYYTENKNIFSIAGYNLPVAIDNAYKYDTFFTQRSSSWGWATWQDRWEQVDWECKSYTDFKNNKLQRKAFSAIGSDLTGMLDKQMNGAIDSWAIRWCFYQFKTNTFSVHPVISKVGNIGFNNNATNTSNYNRYKTVLDNSNKLEFKFPLYVTSQTDFTAKYSQFYSLPKRITGKLLTYLMKFGLIKN